MGCVNLLISPDNTKSVPLHQPFKRKVLWTVGVVLIHKISRRGSLFQLTASKHHHTWLLLLAQPCQTWTGNIKMQPLWGSQQNSLNYFWIDKGTKLLKQKYSQFTWSTSGPLKNNSSAEHPKLPLPLPSTSQPGAAAVIKHVLGTNCPRAGDTSAQVCSAEACRE